MTDRERDVAKWIAGLLDELVRSGMDEDAHHRYRDMNSVEDGGDLKPITPPTGPEILRTWESSSEDVMMYLYPLVRLRFEELVDDYEREDGKKHG